MAKLQNANGNENELRVWSDGCYDMLHFGHANQLRRAKEMGTQLVVGVHADRDIAIHKGPPVFNEEERYALMRSIRWADEVVEESTYFPTVDTLDEHRCAFHVHGDDISLSADGTDVLDHLKAANRYCEIPRTEGISTTALVSRILARINGANCQNGNESPWTMSSTETPKLPADYIAHFAGQLHHYEEEEIVHKNEFHKGMIANGNGTHLHKHNHAGRGHVVYVSGYFDLFHIGHLRFLEAASKLGDHLVVGLYGDGQEGNDHSPIGDEECRGLRPQPGPIMPLQERALILLAFKQVSEVIMGVPRCISEAFILHYGIGLVARGHKSRFNGPSTGIDCFEVPKRMGIFRQIQSGSDVTTGEIIERILARFEEYQMRNNKKQRKELTAYQALQRQDAKLLACS